jgi:hypothetical protein
MENHDSHTAVTEHSLHRGVRPDSREAVRMMELKPMSPWNHSRSMPDSRDPPPRTQLPAPSAAGALPAQHRCCARRGGAAGDTVRLRPPRLRGLRPAPDAAAHTQGAPAQGSPARRAAALRRSHRGAPRSIPGMASKLSRARRRRGPMCRLVPPDLYAFPFQRRTSRLWYERFPLRNVVAVVFLGNGLECNHYGLLQFTVVLSKKRHKILDGAAIPQLTERSDRTCPG